MSQPAPTSAPPTPTVAKNQAKKQQRNQKKGKGVESAPQTPVEVKQPAVISETTGAQIISTVRQVQEVIKESELSEKSNPVFLRPSPAASANVKAEASFRTDTIDLLKYIITKLEKQERELDLLKDAVIRTEEVVTKVPTELQEVFVKLTSEI